MKDSVKKKKSLNSFVYYILCDHTEYILQFNMLHTKGNHLISPWEKNYIGHFNSQMDMNCFFVAH